MCSGEKVRSNWKQITLSILSQNKSMHHHLQTLNSLNWLMFTAMSLVTLGYAVVLTRMKVHEQRSIPGLNLIITSISAMFYYHLASEQTFASPSVARFVETSVALPLILLQLQLLAEVSYPIILFSNALIQLFSLTFLLFELSHGRYLYGWYTFLIAFWVAICAVMVGPTRNSALLKKSSIFESLAVGPPRHIALQKQTLVLEMFSLGMLYELVLLSLYPVSWLLSRLLYRYSAAWVVIFAILDVLTRAVPGVYATYKYSLFPNLVDSESVPLLEDEGED